MKIGKIFLLSSVALMAVACQDKKDDPRPTPTPGEDVCFGGALDGNAGSRTIYGDEVTGEGGAYSFPILWLSDDKVFIASPQCRQDFNSGTFGVPSEADHRNYAGTFIKESGAIQWGSSDKADFYSIYPQRTDDTKFTVTTVENFSASNATFKLNLTDMQTCIVAAPSGSNTSPKMTTADMRACFMYAKHADVENGTSPVTLQYSPLSTAIRFTLRGPSVDQSTVTVQRIRLIGPSGAALSGKFNVDLTSGTPVVTAAGDNSNIVTIYATYQNGAYLQLSTGQSIELNAFIIPLDNMKIDENWQIEVKLSNSKVVTKTLKQSSTTANTNLVAGKIHRLGNMPNLPTAPFDPARWMEFIPRNVYLSEISIPGSWNTLEPSAQDQVSGSTPTQQGINTINDQYAKGCRGFHFDTRYKWTPNIVHHHDYVETIHHNKDGKSSITYWFSGWCTECYNRYGNHVHHDNAYDEEVYNDYDTDESHPTLGVVQGNGTTPVPAFSNLYFMPTDNITFEEALNAIIANVKQTEYMVLSCSWAHNSTDPDTRTLNPTYASTWLRDISEICAAHPEVYDASTITPETTIGDVLGKVIVIVNLEHGINDGYTMPTSSKCLFVNMPQVRTNTMYASGYMSNEYMYKTDKSHNGMKIANTLAQICSHNAALQTDRGWAPTYLQATDQREAAGQTILDWSAAQFASSTYAHDTWQYQGLGGYTVTNSGASSGGPGYEGVASVLNAWIDGRIANMKVSPGSGESIFHPIGLIFMNKVTTVQTGTYPINGPQTCKNILELNNKFQKKFDASKPAWPEQGATVRSAAPGYSSGVKKAGNALGWDAVE